MIGQTVEASSWVSVPDCGPEIDVARMASARTASASKIRPKREISEETIDHLDTAGACAMLMNPFV
jgi:hypothetical protein